MLVADPRPGMSRRPDGITVNINVCEHPEPVGELRRIYDTASETLGFRTLEQFAGRDVLALKLMLHALGYYRPDEKEIAMTGPGANASTPRKRWRRVDRFRSDQEWGDRAGLRGRPRHRAALAAARRRRGRDQEVRKQLLALYRIR